MPGNGLRIGDNFRHGKSVAFTCNDNHELKGVAAISCNDGSWSDSIPQCTGKCKMQLQIMLNKNPPFHIFNKAETRVEAEVERQEEKEKTSLPVQSCRISPDT